MLRGLRGGVRYFHHRGNVPMTAGMMEETTGLLQALLQPWHAALEDPAEAQSRVLRTLLEGYAKTGYGAGHGAAHVETVADYRRAFPVITYEDCKPLIKRVMAGETGLLLYEEPVGWAITRGTTRGESKPTLDHGTEVSNDITKHIRSNNSLVPLGILDKPHCDGIDKIKFMGYIGVVY